MTDQDVTTTPILTPRSAAHESAGVRPMTGAEYLESLRDGREVWIYGERVEDVTTHPAFRNTAQTVARLYDALHDPAQRGVLTMPADTPDGTFTHPFFRAPKTVADLRASREAITAWQRMTYGWMGRTPDYKASFLGTLGAAPDFYGPFAENARSWYRRAQNEVLFFGHALAGPPAGRSGPPEQTAEVCVRVVGETDAGIIVSGSKAVATGAALTHQLFIGYGGPPLTDADQATMFIARMDTPGLKLVCRASYEHQARQTGSVFDYPLSSRFDENDAFVVFDRALIPWSDVLTCRDPERTNDFVHGTGFLQRFVFHGATRLAVKLDFLCGVLLKAVRATGNDAHRGVQVGLGEALAWRHMVHALVTAMTEGAEPWAGRHVAPNLNAATAHRALAATAYRRVKNLIQDQLAGALISLPSHAHDFGNPELRPYLDTYLRGAGDLGAEERVKLMKLAWDSVGSEFASRHELYERLWAAAPEVTRIEAYRQAVDSGLHDELCGFVDTFLSGYDTGGPVGSAPDILAPVSGAGR